MSVESMMGSMRSIVVALFYLRSFLYTQSSLCSTLSYVEICLSRLKYVHSGFQTVQFWKLNALIVLSSLYTTNQTPGYVFCKSHFYFEFPFNRISGVHCIRQVENISKLSLTYRILSVCAPPPPQYVMLPPVREHVSLHTKSLCKNMARASRGCK